MHQAIEDITRATNDWGAAFMAGDVSRTLEFLTQDAVLIPPNEPAVIGGEAIEAWSQRMFEAATIQEVDITVDGVRVAGDWAVSHGVWHMTMSVGEAIVSDTTRYVVIWERQMDGAWKVAHDVWNSALPAESSA